MFEALLWATIAVACIGLFLAMDGSRDVFHPLAFIGPMLIFLYGWMPYQLLSHDGLSRFFDNEQLVSVQTLNLCGVTAFVAGCLLAGLKRMKKVARAPQPLTERACLRLLIGATAVGSIGLVCWLISIHNVGGFVNAFSKSYSGGWDDNGYVRDSSLLLLVAVLLSVAALTSGLYRTLGLVALIVFGTPWLAQAILTARRGPTFAIAVVVMMSWFLYRNRRPPVLATFGTGFLLGYLALFLVSNRSNIYIGSEQEFTTDVTDIVEKPDAGNEFVYGTGSVISAERRDHYFWMRRYLAQVLVRPIPSAIWPTKYEDFGVPELLSNAGTGEGFADALGWKGAVGSAPGIIADLWIEAWWLAVALMFGIGWVYGRVWLKALSGHRAWISQYVILSALSIYLVMQTMEAIIFRVLLLSIPAWLVWKWALRAVPKRRRRVALYSDPHMLPAARSHSVVAPEQMQEA